jgi:hypothetical protein
VKNVALRANRADLIVCGHNMVTEDGGHIAAAVELVAFGDDGGEVRRVLRTFDGVVVGEEVYAVCWGEATSTYCCEEPGGEGEPVVRVARRVFVRGYPTRPRPPALSAEWMLAHIYP